MNRVRQPLYWALVSKSFVRFVQTWVEYSPELRYIGRSVRTAHLGGEIVNFAGPVRRQFLLQVPTQRLDLSGQVNLADRHSHQVEPVYHVSCGEPAHIYGPCAGSIAIPRSRAPSRESV